METLSKIIVTKYFPGIECIKPSDRLTDDEYQIVKRCTLDDLLGTESNPAGLEQICEGEKVQTAEYYKQKEKKFQRNLVKLHRKPPKSPRERRVVPPVVPSTRDNRTVANDDQSAARDQQLAPRDGQPPTHLIVAEELQEPIRSNETNIPQHDPYQLPDEIAPLATVQPLALLPEDENFGSKDVDGARDFLQLCTGEELPPMSLRESLTRNMLMAQFPSIPKVAPLVDNFQELDLRGINTPMFKRPLQTSTPLVADAEQVAQLPLPALDDLIPVQEAVDEQRDLTVEVQPTATVQAVPPLAQSLPASTQALPALAQALPTSAQALPLGDSFQIPSVERGSSSGDSETPAPQPRRIRREVAFTGRLEPFPTSVPMPKERRIFNIFSFPCPTIWNKTIQDVETQLAERWKLQQLREAATLREALAEPRKDSGFQQQLHEVPVLRDALADQRIDSGFQQTMDEAFRNIPPANVTETSNILANAHMEAEAPSKPDSILTSDLIATMQPIDLDQPGSIDGKLLEVSDRVHLKPPSTETPSFSHEKTTVDKGPPAVEPILLLEESTKNTVAEPKAAQQQKKYPRRNANKQTMQGEIDPIADISSVLYNQAQELDAILEDDETEEEAEPLDPTIVDILNVLQGELCEGESDSVSIERLKQLLRIGSALVAAKMFKNLIILKMADLLDIETSSELRITSVSIRLPQVADLDVP